MPGFLLHATAGVQCAHAALANVAATGARVKVMGQPVAILGDKASVAGCPFQIPIGTGTKPQPCVVVNWTTSALRVKVMNKPVLLATSPGVCQSAEQIPQGPPTVTATQTRVRGQ